MNIQANNKKVIAGISWSSLSSIVNYILLFTRTLILVRILAPEDFGIMALSLLLVTTIKQFSNMGLEQALVQKDKVTESTVNTIWVASILRGIIFFILIILISPLYADFFDEQKLTQILLVISFATIINGFKNSYSYLLQKELRFEKIFKLVVFSGIIEFISTISLALIFENAMALAVGYLIGSISLVILSFTLIKRKPRLVFTLSEFVELFRFGKWVLTGGIIIFLILNIDIFTIGKLLGVASLGLYQIVYRFANFAATDITLTFSQSLYPSFALVKEDLFELRKYFLHTILVIMLIIFPFMVLLFLYADNFINYFIGAQWMPALQAFKILVIFGMLRSLASICGFIFWTVGKPYIQTYISLFQFVLIATLIYPLTIKYGISGTAASITIPLLLSSLFSFYFVKRELKLEIINVVSYILPLILSTIFLILVVLLSQIYLGYIVSIYSLILSFILLFFLYFASALIFDYFGKKELLN